MVNLERPLPLTLGRVLSLNNRLEPEWEKGATRQLQGVLMWELEMGGTSRSERVRMLASHRRPLQAQGSRLLLRMQASWLQQPPLWSLEGRGRACW